SIGSLSLTTSASAEPRTACARASTVTCRTSGNASPARSATLPWSASAFFIVTTAMRSAGAGTGLRSGAALAGAAKATGAGGGAGAGGAPPHAKRNAESTQASTGVERIELFLRALLRSTDTGASSVFVEIVGALVERLRLRRVPRDAVPGARHLRERAARVGPPVGARLVAQTGRPGHVAARRPGAVEQVGEEAAAP